MATILVVDDDEMNRELLRQRLGRRGYDVLTAADGRHGMALAQTAHPDLILMDVALPDLSGLAVTRLLKARPETATIPLIVITAYGMIGDRAACLAAGCDDYASKPIDFPRLITQIEGLLGRTPAGPPDP
ncbi:MAG TPA: response regulator [Chloroflexia bacterium]|nr:response regulator [Chloroflexia bacterium]